MRRDRIARGMMKCCAASLLEIYICVCMYTRGHNRKYLGVKPYLYSEPIELCLAVIAVRDINNKFRSILIELGSL